MRKFDYSISFREISDEAAKSLKTCSVSVISPLLIDSLLCLGSSDSIIVRDISYLSQNLNKYNNLSDVQQVSIIERLRSVAPSSEHFSDEELLSHMKSRYAQLPAEIDGFINYINSNIDLIKSDIAAAAADKLAADADNSAGTPGTSADV